MAMHDQAYKLRKLVRDASRIGMPAAGPAPQMIVMIGGKTGVGTTTISVNLAVALAQQGRRAVLVDLNLERPNVAQLCGIAPSLGVVDILSAQRDIHEVLQPGPAGLQIVAGSDTAQLAKLRSGVALQRLIDQLRSLGRHADLVILDIGTQTNDVAAGAWSSADHLLMVTTSDSDCVMDTYASIKWLLGRDQRLPETYTIVNRENDDSVADDVHRRIHQSCRRFLSMDVRAAGHVPADEFLARAEERAVPASSQSPMCPAARAIDRIAAKITAKPTMSSWPPIERSAA